MATQLRSVLPPIYGLHNSGLHSSPCRRVTCFPHQNPISALCSGSAPGKRSTTVPFFSISYPQISTEETGEWTQPGGDCCGSFGDGGEDDGSSNNGGGGGGDGNSPDGPGGSGDSVGKGSSGGIFAVFWKGWNERVSADPQFPFKVLMEEVVGVGACVLGDMASRPNFGLNELDFVFSTVVVGSILNFSLMYMLAPTAAASAAGSLPGVFAACPAGHMFEHGAYSLLDRLGTFVYKGAVFATVGFGAGLLGTAISNVLISMRKKMDTNSGTESKSPPTVLNAATWAIHMGISSNLRYQVINGLEFAMANVLPPAMFKASILFTRAGNNVLGGMSFVALARLTGSQKAEAPQITLSADEDVLIKETIEKPLPSEVDSTKESSLALLKDDESSQ